MSETPLENKIAKIVTLLRIGTWTLFTLFVAAILAITVLGPFLLGNPAVAGGARIQFGLLLFGLLGGTVVAVFSELVFP